MSIFSYDSKLNQVLGFIGDLFIINVMYLVCCIPIVTIGAAQSGLYTAMKVLQDPNDDNSAIKAFFRGFKSGFFTVMLVHTIFLVLDAILLYTLFMAYEYRELDMFIHWAFPLVILILCMVVHSLVPAFHSRFACKPFHLFRNCVLLLISRPIRSLAVGALTWAPLVLFLLKTNTFIRISVVFITVYYSIAFLFNVVIMQKPFKLLIEEIDPDEEIQEVK